MKPKNKNIYKSKRGVGEVTKCEKLFMKIM